jgi:NADP-dependent 3-hydroxy acid dehydrogenase YdfG
MGNVSLFNRVAIVTGASSGIGRETALALAHAGACVALAARREEPLQQLAQEIRALGREALVTPTDVTCREQVEHLVQKTISTWGQVDILVANAGAYIRGPAAEIKVSEIERAMAVNFYGALYAVRAVLPDMRARREGDIVLISTMDAKKGLPLDGPYVAAKSALSGFGEVLRQELYGSGVRVMIVFPGRVDTPMIQHIKVPWISRPISPEAVARAVVKGIQRQRIEVIIPLIAWSLSWANTLSPRLADWLVRRLHLQGWEDDPAHKKVHPQN